jgi:hypothetical protein
MVSISKRTGKHFTGKFAETAVKIGLASENLEGNEQDNVPAPPSKVAKKTKEVVVKKSKPPKVAKKEVKKKK